MPNVGEKVLALGRMKAGKMNKTEAQYSQLLEILKKAGDIIWYKFEPIRLKLGDRCFYSPDFLVLNKDSQLEIHEIKGYWHDDARVKIKLAAEIYPFKFIGIKKKGKHWETEEF